MSHLHACSTSGRPAGPHGGSPRRPAGSRRAALAACSALMLLGTVLTGCSSDTGTGEERATSTRAGDDDRPLKVTTTVTRVLGELSEEQRRELAVQARTVITGYLEAAYLHQRPSSGYRGAFPGFTRGARALALEDTGVVSDRSFADAEEVRPRGGVAYLSVVAPDGRPVGATARVSVDLAVADSRRTRRLTVSGRLLLTPRADRWRIFGYDLSLQPTPAGRS